MKHHFFKTVPFLFVLSSLVSFACKEPANPCVQALRQLDEALIQRADSLIKRRAEFTVEPYRAELEKLRIEEKQLFKEVENCDFGKDLQAYNYWYRGRLKFPGKVEQELQRLERDSVK